MKKFMFMAVLFSVSAYASSEKSVTLFACKNITLLNPEMFKYMLNMYPKKVRIGMTHHKNNNRIVYVEMTGTVFNDSNYPVKGTFNETMKWMKKTSSDFYTWNDGITVGVSYASAGANPREFSAKGNVRGNDFTATCLEITPVDLNGQVRLPGID